MSTVSSLEQIFFECLQKGTPHERAMYLAQACAGDEDLIRRLRKMLEAQGSNFLEQSAYVSEALDESHSVNELPGLLIGPYRLVEQIGGGGMGTVWRAEQVEPVKRLVALKLIKAGLDSKQVIARFEAERQALALMGHPNIARVLDGGTDSFGRPYFVMDLFEGVPITRFCDEQRMTVRQRLELFSLVCAAIQHAHQKGVIHRDIKPSNVLVALQDGRAVPKVIDFGIAKAIEQKHTEHTVLTQPGALVGTLEYMSPEQSASDAGDIDTRSDIYSLGVLLYELLTGSTPLSPLLVEKASLADILHAIADDETPKPSTRLRDVGAEITTIAASRGVERLRLAKTVSGELDWIVLKALEKDRNRRYATAGDLEADVQRFLTDLPVLAGPPSAVYRLRKFARRNRVALAAGSVLVVALFVAIGGVGWAMRDRAARTAEEERVVADRRARVSTTVQGLLASADLQMASQSWPEALTTVRRADVAATSGEADAEIAHKVRTLLRDLEFVDRLDRIRSRQATWTTSAVFDSSAAVREYAQAFQDHGIDIESASAEATIDRLRTTPAVAVPLAAGLDDFAKHHLHAYRKLASFQRILLIANALDPEPVRALIRSCSLKPDAAAAEELQRLADSIDVRAHPPVTLVALARALNKAQPAMAIRLLSKAQHSHPGDFWLAFELGSGLDKAQDVEGAIRYYTAAVAIRPESAPAHSNLGLQLRFMRNMEAAVASMRRAIELDPDISVPHLNLGLALLDLKKRNEALESMHRAIDLAPNLALVWAGMSYVRRERGELAEALAAAHKAISSDPNCGSGHVALGSVLATQGHIAASVSAFRKAIELNPLDAVAHANLGSALSHDPASIAEAIAECRRAIELNPRYAIGYSSLGNALFAQGQTAEAIDAYNQAVDLDPSFAAAYSNLAVALSSLKRTDEAIAACNKAIAADPNDKNAYLCLATQYDRKGEWLKTETTLLTLIGIDPRNAKAHHGLAVARTNLGKQEEAIAAYRRAAEIEPESADRQLVLGLCLNSNRYYSEAEAAYRKAIELAPKYSKVYGVLGDVLHRQKKDNEAILAYRAAIDADPNFSGAHLGLGEVLRIQGKFAEAIDATEQGIRLGKLDARTAGKLALLLATCPDIKLRNGVRAVELATSATKMEPGNPNYFRTLGAAHYQAGNWKKALDAQQRATELAPNSLGFNWFIAAMAHQQLGNSVEARSSYDRGCEWLKRTPSQEEAMAPLRKEAATLLGIEVR